MKINLVAACLLLAFPAAGIAETIYKYRGAGGKPVYSNRIIPGGQLIESYEYTAPPAPSPQPDTSKSDADGEKRIRKQLSNLDAAWEEVKATGAALAAAEARLAAGITPQEAEVLARGGPEAPPTETGPPVTPPVVVPPVLPKPPPRPLGTAPIAPVVVAPPAPPSGPASPSIGGPMAPASRSDGGPAFAAPPSAGGPMAVRRGGGMRPEYAQRMAALEADVARARLRNQEAWSRFNQLR